jgi:hypothetical protein
MTAPDPLHTRPPTDPLPPAVPPAPGSATPVSHATQGAAPATKPSTDNLHSDDLAPADEGALESLGRAVGEAVLGGPQPAQPTGNTPPGKTTRTLRLADLPTRSGRRR